MTRSFRAYAALAATILTLVATPHLRAQAPVPSSIAGKWDGTVTADIGEMRIILTVTIAEKTGVATGQVENAHGIFTIKDGTFLKGEWSLPFTADDGSAGVMKGKISGDDFAGSWDFHPRAVGTFALKRVK